MGKLTRRDFLKASAVTLGSACCVQATGLFRPNLAVAQTKAGTNGRVWFHVFLNGGWDDLNGPNICFGSSAYNTVRPLIAISNPLVTELNVRGMHPSMANLFNIYNANQLAILTRVGTAKSTQSHDQEQLAYRGFMNGTGGMGRLFDHAYNQGASLTDFQHFTIGMGTPEDSYCAREIKRPINLSSIANYSFGTMSGVDNTTGGNQENVQRRATLDSLVGLPTTGAMPNLSKQATEGAFATIATVAQSLTNWNSTGGPNQVTFGNNNPGPATRDACILAQALNDGLFGSGAMIVNAEMGGYDTHSGQLAAQTTLFQRLDQALNAFRNRAIARGFWNNVVITVSSEFGRTPKGTDSAGTDHAKATSMLVLGGAVNGGVTYGNPISNAEFTGNQNSINVTYRFESFYSQLASWLGLDPTGLWDPYTPPDYGINLV